MTGGRRLARGPGGRPTGWVLFAATFLAVAGILAPARAPVAAAANDGLNLTGNATYTIEPARHVIRVVIDLTARNDKPNVTSGGVITKYFYDGARLAIQAEATNVRATVDGSRLTATVKRDDGFAILDVRFRRAIFFHQTAKARITFDLPGGAPRSASDIRVGPAFATFVAWAFGDGGSVRINVPAAFTAATTGSAMTRTTSGQTTILRASSIADTAEWYVVVNAENESALTRERLDLAGGEHIVIRAWPEDADWRAQVKELLVAGLPELAALTGLDWPVAGDLSIFEVHTPLLEGYGGVYFVDEDKIEVSEDLDDLTILHEASHAWFNGALFNGRWINEGFADTYAELALDSIGQDGWAPDSVNPNDAAAVPLMTWEHPGRIEDEATNAREQYGYNASWTVVRTLHAEIGDDALRKVFAAAHGRQIPYVGAGVPELTAGPPDWRRFLDLLEEVGGSKTASELFRRWVVTDAEIDALDKRAAARTAYVGLVEAGGDWLTPHAVRGPMSVWDFPAATVRIAEATAILDQRDEIARLAAELGVEPPLALRTAYQTATASFDAARALAATGLAEVQALGAAVAAAAAPRGPIVALGLVGAAPDVDLAAARSAFSAGSADAATRAAAVVAVIDGAEEIGRGRLISAVAALLVVLIAIVAVIVITRRRAAARPPYATLADQSGGTLDRVPDVPRSPLPDPAAEAIGPPPADRSDAS
jgi:hypothetical protein